MCVCLKIFDFSCAQLVELLHRTCRPLEMAFLLLVCDQVWDSLSQLVPDPQVLQVQTCGYFICFPFSISSCPLFFAAPPARERHAVWSSLMIPQGGYPFVGPLRASMLEMRRRAHRMTTPLLLSLSGSVQVCKSPLFPPSYLCPWLMCAVDGSSHWGEHGFRLQSKNEALLMLMLLGPKESGKLALNSVLNSFLGARLARASSPPHSVFHLFVLTTKNTPLCVLMYQSGVHGSPFFQRCCRWWLTGVSTRGGRLHSRPTNH